jgi:hypothetical protein
MPDDDTGKDTRLERHCGPGSVTRFAFAILCAETFLWSHGAEARVGGRSPPYNGLLGAVQSITPPASAGRSRRAVRAEIKYALGRFADSPIPGIRMILLDFG